MGVPLQVSACRCEESVLCLLRRGWDRGYLAQSISVEGLASDVGGPDREGAIKG